MGKTAGADALAEMGDGLRVAEKVLKAHGLSVEQSGRAVEKGRGRHSWMGLGRLQAMQGNAGQTGGVDTASAGPGAATEADRHQTMPLTVSNSSPRSVRAGEETL